MATQFAKASYTEVIDLQTTNGKTSIIGIHTPVGIQPYQRLFGFFNQFRKFRYKGISSLVMVPAANLPVDPLGLTGVQGTTDLMDPRDNLNPIIFHGAHGSALTTILDTIYSADEYVASNGNPTSNIGRNVSPSTSESVLDNSTSDLTGSYYRCLTDTSWRKFGIQNGVRLKGLHPLVHRMARNIPLLPAVGFDGANAGQVTRVDQNATSGRIENVAEYLVIADNNTSGQVNVPHNTVPNTTVWDGTASGYLRPEYVQEFTNGMARLDWLPTATMVQTTSTPRLIEATALPKLYMGVLVLPPAYNVEQYFRMVIRHEFEFKDFTTSLGLMGFGSDSLTPNSQKNVTSYYNWIDYSDAESSSKVAAIEGLDSAGSTIDMIGGTSEVVSDGVA